MNKTIAWALLSAPSFVALAAMLGCSWLGWPFALWFWLYLILSPAFLGFTLAAVIMGAFAMEQR